MRKFYDRYWKALSALIFYTYLVLAYFDLVDKWVPKILILDGVLAGISVIYLLIWLYFNRKPKLDAGVILCIIFTLSMVISSIIGPTNINRLAVLAFQIVQIFTVALALYSLYDEICPILWWGGLFAVVFIAIGVKFSLTDFDPTHPWQRLEFLGTGTNSSGANFGIVTLIALMMIRRKHNILINLFLLSFVPYLFHAQTLTKSRTAQLATVLGFVVWAFAVFFKEKKLSIKTILICTIILLIGLVFLFAFLTSDRVQGKTYESFDEMTGHRVRIWKESIAAMGTREFLFGFGGNTERMTAVIEESGASSPTVEFASWHFLHNIYVQIFVDYGIIALASFILLTSYLFIKGLIGLYAAKKNSRESYLLPPALALIAFLTAQNMMESLSLFIGGSEQMVFVTSFAIIYSLTKNGEKEP